MRQYLLCAALCAIGCSAPRPPEPLPAPASGDASISSGAEAIELLRELRGSFHFIDPERTGLYFRGGESLFRRVGAADSSVVPALIKCLGDSTQASATLDQRRLPIAAVCWHAFARTAYYSGHSRFASLPLKYRDRPRVTMMSTHQEFRQLSEWWQKYWDAGSPLLPSRPPNEEFNLQEL
jgi:hypothetical protein